MKILRFLAIASLGIVGIQSTYAALALPTKLSPNHPKFCSDGYVSLTFKNNTRQKNKTDHITVKVRYTSEQNKRQSFHIGKNARIIKCVNIDKGIGLQEFDKNRIGDVFHYKPIPVKEVLPFGQQHCDIVWHKGSIRCDGWS